MLSSITDWNFRSRQVSQQDGWVLGEHFRDGEGQSQLLLLLQGKTIFKTTQWLNVCVTGQPDMKMLRLVRAPTGKDAPGSTTSRRSLRRSSSKTSTSTLKTRPRLPTEAILPMSPMRRCRSWVCPFLPILYFNHEIDCICLFSQGALWQLLWGCLRRVRGQIWTGSKNHQKCWQSKKIIRLGWGDERVRQLGWSSGN